MDKIKKIANELSVFCIVFVCVIGLLTYKHFNMNDYTYISSQKAVEMINDDKDFILVFGTTKLENKSNNSQMDPAILTKEQASYHKAFVKKNRQKIYFVDTKEIEDLSSYMSDNFNTDSTIPQTLFIKDGEVILQKNGVLKYVDFSNLVTEWKNS